MPLGFIKGNSYHLNWDYDRFAALPVFGLLTRYAMKKNFGLHFTFSHISRAYDCEIRKVEYFKHSAQPYFMGVANRGGANPLEAAINALRVVMPSTPYFEVLCLEAECVLLGLAVGKARDIEAKIEKVLDELGRLCTLIGVASDYECENCIGMIEHGCYCKAMGASAPGMPPEEWFDVADIEDMVFPPKEDEIEERPDIMPAGIPADPGEDDDL